MLTAQLKKPQNTVTYENVDILLFISVTLKHRFTVYIINDSTLVMMCHVLAIKKKEGTRLCYLPCTTALTNIQLKLFPSLCSQSMRYYPLTLCQFLIQ